jgi:hypothetical protein
VRGNTNKYNNVQILDLSHFENLDNWDNETETGLCLVYAQRVKYVKFMNTPGNPYSIRGVTRRINNEVTSVNFFHGMTELIRVFGNISLDSPSTFDGCSKYFIHDEVKTGGVTNMPEKGAFYGTDTSTELGKSSWYNDINLDSNIVVGGTSAAYTFRGTSVNLYDVYYFLQLCENVTNLAYCFSNSKAIVTSMDNNLSRDTFKYCSKVTNISSIFQGCTNMRGILYSPSHTDEGVITSYDGLLSPLKAVTSINSAFYACNFEYMDDLFFGRLSDTQELKITSLSTVFYNYHPRFVKNTGDSEMVLQPAKASRLLANLPELTSISYMFNTSKTVIEFDTVTEVIDGVSVTYCPLFFNNVNLKTVVNSFIDFIGFGSLINIFGGQSELRLAYPNNFPKSLTDIRNSFRSSTGYEGQNIQHPLRNDMFSRIKGSITNISGATSGVTSESSSFTGSNIIKTYNPEDNDHYVFPYLIFSGCTKLRDISSFFNGLNYQTDEVIELPGPQLFKDTTSLVNISYAFARMSGFRFRLTSKGFINTKLTNVHSVFRSNTYNRVGMIPYGLFYMESTASKVVRGWKHSDGINTSYGFDEHGEYDPDAPMPIPKNYTVTYRKINSTITEASYCLYDNKGTDLVPYTASFGGMTSIADSGDLLIYNENYNDVPFILNPNFNADVESPTIDNPYWDPQDPESEQFIPNPVYDNRRVIDNPEYDPKFRVWNPRVVDGTNIRDMIEASPLYTSSNGAYGDLPEEYYDVNNNHDNPSATGKLATMNYMCPPDLFSYCLNSSSTRINYSLAETSRRGSVGDENYGLYGRIPPTIFKPITKVDTIEGVFKNNLYIVPYSWGKYIDSNGVESDVGRVYHPDLLKGFGSSLKSIAYLFSATRLADGCIIDESFLRYNTSLQNLEGTWGSSCIWDTNVNIQQVPASLFSNNRLINNIIDLFGNGKVVTDPNYRNGPSIIDASWFTASNHKSLAKISYFLSRCSQSTGTLPPLWEWTNIPASDRVYAFNGLSQSRITNLMEAAASKYSSSVTDIRP